MKVEVGTSRAEKGGENEVKLTGSETAQIGKLVTVSLQMARGENRSVSKVEERRKGPHAYFIPRQFRDPFEKGT